MLLRHKKEKRIPEFECEGQASSVELEDLKDNDDQPLSDKRYQWHKADQIFKYCKNHLSSGAQKKFFSINFSTSPNYNT